MHNIAVFGEFLYWRPRNSEIPYAVIQNSNLPVVNPPVQVSPIALTDHDYEPAFRAGFSVSLGTCSSVTVQYTRFEATTADAIDLTGFPGLGVFGMTLHPAQNTSSNATAATASDFLSFDTIDADYRELLSYGPSHRINYVIGASYSNLEQDFSASYINNDTETVSTNINFDGAGLRLGLEMERYSRNRTMITYCKALSTILAGEFQASYLQGTGADPVIVQTAWEAGRIVPILEMEAGFGWQFHQGAYRLTAGYNFTSWFNTVKTQDWINSVQTNNFNSLGDTMTFDGLVARIEARF
ncbi:MAG: hypothetical protein KDB14_24055 [Planctomycetales bacterium]|nr:hypothetical protein [Planctomycetales bacterium]